MSKAATAEAFNDILTSGQENVEGLWLAVFGPEYPGDPAGRVLEYGSKEGLYAHLKGLDCAGPEERAFGLWWLAEEVASGRCLFVDAGEACVP